MDEDKGRLEAAENEFLFIWASRTFLMQTNHCPQWGRWWGMRYFHLLYEPLVKLSTCSPHIVYITFKNCDKSAYKLLFIDFDT